MEFAQDVGNAKQTAVIRLVEYAGRKNRGRKLAKEVNKVSKREYREKNGLCFFCDEPRKPGYKLCERHYQMNVDKANSQRAKDVRKNLIKNCILYK